jgi:uncharacterized protein (DUF2267 family)
MLVRGIYYEAYHPAGKPEKIRSSDEFLHRVSSQIRGTRPINAGDATRAVFGVIGRHCDPGEVRDVVTNLPAAIRNLWPNHERHLSPAPAAAG